jgi:hypothetical protein
MDLFIVFSPGKYSKQNDIFVPDTDSILAEYGPPSDLMDDDYAAACDLELPYLPRVDDIGPNILL